MASDSGVMPKDWRLPVIDTLYKNKRERTEI